MYTHQKFKDRQAVFFVFRHKTHPFKINLFLNLSYLELHYLLANFQCVLLLKPMWSLNRSSWSRLWVSSRSQFLTPLLLSYTRLVPVCLISPVPITWLNLRVNTAIYFLSSEFGYLFTYVKLSITYGLKLFRFVKNRCRSQTLFRFYLIFLVKMVKYCAGYASKNVNLCCL